MFTVFVSSPSVISHTTIHYKHKLFRQQYQIFFLQSDDSASFLRAARGGNSEKVLEYLKNGIDINTCNAVSFNIQCPSHTAPVVRRVGLCFTLPRQYMREPTITLFVGFAFPFPNLKFICSHCNFARPILCQWSTLAGKFMSLQQYPLEVCLLDGSNFKSDQNFVICSDLTALNFRTN